MFVYLSFVEWSGAFQRPQHLCWRLAERGWSVFYVSLRRLHHWLADQDPHVTLLSEQHPRQNLTVLEVAGLPRDRQLHLCRQLNNWLLFYWLAHKVPWKARKLQLMVNAPYFNPTLRRVTNARLAYDIMDELSGDDRRLQNEEQWLLRHADKISAGTFSIKEAKETPPLNIDFIPCGVDYEHFAANGERAEELKGIESPIVGFYGAINERVDPELIALLAKNLVRGSIVLVGPIYSTGRAIAKIPGITILGKKPYEQLPRYLRAFDIAMVPYRLSGGVEFVNPVKILEYLAGGKPVVSTDLSDVRRFFSGSVFIARSHQEFVELVNRLIRGELGWQDQVRHGREQARERGWEHMVDEFEQKVLP